MLCSFFHHLSLMRWAKNYEWNVVELSQSHSVVSVQRLQRPHKSIWIAHFLSLYLEISSATTGLLKYTYAMPSRTCVFDGMSGNAWVEGLDNEGMVVGGLTRLDSCDWWNWLCTYWHNPHMHLCLHMILCVLKSGGIIHYFLHCTDLKVTLPNLSTAVRGPEISRIPIPNSLGGAFGWQNTKH